MSKIQFSKIMPNAIENVTIAYEPNAIIDLSLDCFGVDSDSKTGKANFGVVSGSDIEIKLALAAQKVRSASPVIVVEDPEDWGSIPQQYLSPFEQKAPKNRTPAIDMRCIRCDKELENLGGDNVCQPNDGLAFQSRGHYGTTFFDPGNGDFIEIVVCDQCLRARFGVNSI